MIQQHNCATSLSLIPSYCDIKMGVDWSSLENQGKGSQNMLLWINSYVNKTKKKTLLTCEKMETTSLDQVTL